MVLGGKLATKTSFSLSRPSSPRVEDLKGDLPAPPPLPATAVPPSLWADHLCPLSPGAALYGRLKEYLLTEDQLKENGYPFPHPERPGGAVIFTAEDKKPKDCEWPSAPPVLEEGQGDGGSGRAAWGQGVAGPDASPPARSRL